MINKLKTFLNSDTGAVTVDWVVLTAAVVSLAVLSITSIQGGAGSVGDGTGDYLTNRTVGD